MKTGIDYREIGKRIRLERQKRGMNQEKLAEMAEISTSFVGHIERAEKIPSVETIVKIGESLEMDLNYLLLGRLKCDRQNCTLYEAIRRIVE